MTKLKVGLIGAGNISDAYIKGLKMFSALSLSAISDIDADRAKAKAEEHSVAKGYHTDELLADPDIDLVVNLTFPTVHAEVTLQALSAGKHVYSEKPLAIAREDAKQILETAEAKDLRVGCAPDTFLGGGLQTCRQLIDEGAIGDPIAASAFMMGYGVEAWHPNPFFFFEYGGHPLFDMGPYYFTALVNLLGPVKTVTGLMHTGIKQRTVTSQPHAGKVIDVKAPIHATALLELTSGIPVTTIISGEVIGSELPRIEIYGTKGALSVPDPNTFNGPVRVKTRDDEDWRDVPLTHGYTDNSRGLGAADLAQALTSKRDHRASAKLAYHVLDVMQSVQEASDTRSFVAVKSTCARPAPLPTGLKAGEIE